MTPPKPIQYDPSTYVATHNAQMAAYVAHDNIEATSRYTLAMVNYNLFIDQVEKQPYWPLPTVPPAMGLSPVDPSGFVYEIQTTDPVCDIIPVHEIIRNPGDIHAAAPSMNISIGKEDLPTNPGWFSANPDDTIPGGMKVPGTSADGVKGQFLRITEPFGNGLYLKLA